MPDRLNIPEGLDWPVRFRQTILEQTYEFRFRESTVDREPPGSDDLEKTFRERGVFRSAETFDPDSVDKVETFDVETDTLIETLSASRFGTGKYRVQLDEEKYESFQGYYSVWTYTEGADSDDTTKNFFVGVNRFTRRRNTVTIDVIIGDDTVIEGQPVQALNPIGFGYNELPIIFVTGSSGDERLRPTRQRLINGDVNIFAIEKDD